MSLMESFRVALRALSASKLRTTLTLLGVVIGVGAVIALMSIGKGMQAGIAAQIKSLGSNLLFITPGAPSEGGIRGRPGTLPTLTVEDAEAIVESGQVPEVANVAPEMFSFGQVVTAGQNAFTRITGVTGSFLDVRNLKLAEGEFFTSEHLDGRSPVAVLGATSARNLFPDSPAVGQSVRINGVSLRVIGVLTPKGAQALGDQDDMVYVPLSTLHARINRARTAQGGQVVGTINVQLVDDRPETVAAATEKIAALLRERHRTAEDDFTIRSQQDLLSTASEVAQFVTVFLGSVAGISLLVGGIGIMNIMLVSVTERTREIGLRKAVGARPQDILSQFLVEAVAVSLLGGLIGILVGGGGARLLDGIRLAGPSSQPVSTVVTPDAIALAFVVSCLVGLFFGVYPAVRASRLNPIEALRYE